MKPLVRPAAAAALALGLLSAGASLAEERLAPGMWTSATTVNGVALGEAPPQCVDAAAAKTANGSDAEVAAAIDAENAKNGCVTKDLVIDGPRIAFSTVCQGVTVRSDVIYRGDESSGSMTTMLPGGKSKVSAVTSRRTGDCK